MKARIHHIIRDLKFFNGVYNQFEQISEIDNNYHILKSLHFNDITEQYLYEKNRIFVHDSVNSILKLSENFDKKDVIFFHSMHPDFYFLKNRLSEFKTIITIFGFEIYNNKYIYPEKKLYDKITYRKFAIKDVSLLESLKIKLIPFLRKSIGLNKISKKEYFLRFYKNTDIIALPYKEESLHLKKIINQKLKVLSFTYYPLDYIIDLEKPFNNKKKYIQVGNSATATNNHLDIFKKINSLTNVEDMIIIPSSYGEKSYLESIKEVVKEKSNYTFQEDFVSINDYNKFIEEVKIAIFNTRRQQAFGNIISLVYAGAKVFVSESNSLYHYLINNGIKVFSYEKELNTIEWNPLRIEEVKKNREKLEELFKQENLIYELRKSLKNNNII